MEKPPTISKELVQWLDHNFPVVQPKMQDTDREIFYKVGQRSVMIIYNQSLTSRTKIY